MSNKVKSPERLQGGGQCSLGIKSLAGAERAAEYRLSANLSNIVRDEGTTESLSTQLLYKKKPYAPKNWQPKTK